ncbi:hypothetical protein ACVGVM_12255 [Pseudonocardia bannensis]|uniref:Uncharacterized protein n=1 Tax=Pseudonocardia bannensis TaxID=630973 RepID=A0A848DF77_9PSEU|nr:hypothetical protein [Pseudonocardia bannensis]NMH91239.1 hypothetical protein [Pseudonocardia bannensis]
MRLGSGGRGPRPAYVCGGAVAVLGAQLMLSVDWGTGLAIGTAVALVAVGVWLHDLVLLGVGSVATLLTVPAPSRRIADAQPPR